MASTYHFIDPQDEEGPTLRLYLLSKKSNWNPDPMLVRTCVGEGADVCEQVEKGQRVLQKLMENGKIECVRECLATESDIDWTIRNEWGTGPLHIIASASSAATLLLLLLERLDEHPSDTIDWSMQNMDGNDFISFAAGYGNLSEVWPVLCKKQVPYFMELMAKDGRIPITCRVQQSDWSNMKPEEQKGLNLLRGIR